MSERLVAIATLARNVLENEKHGDGRGGDRGLALRAALMRVLTLAQESGTRVTPERRPSETCTVTWRGQEIAVTGGFRPGTRCVIDVTARGWRVGTDLQCLADDASSLISSALQRGLSVSELRRLTGAAPVTVAGETVDEPVSVIGAILWGLERLEGSA